MPHISIWNPYPVAWTNPVTMRASAALPAAGAWDATPTEQGVAGAGSILLNFTYTEGAVGGAFDWQMQTSIYSIAALAPGGIGEWATESLYSAGGVAAGVDSQSRVQREYQTYNPVGVGAETFSFGLIQLGHNVERIRIVARESGVVGTPGTLQVTMVCYP